jgi:hypothetical protein
MKETLSSRDSDIELSFFTIAPRNDELVGRCDSSIGGDIL